ncbi:MAG: TauD/TfdA family dioxygenase [Alphaproteobacteria bacterium]|nr:TauD/TfdA family dioxygenase [Alphaproteobacteria bacterium]
MPFTIRPLDAPLGAEVIGFDIDRDATPEATRRLKDAWLQYVVLCFRGQDVGPGDFVRLARLFGTPTPQPLQRPEYQVEGYPELRVLSSQQRDTLGDNRLLRVGGSWHSDHSHQQEPPRGTMLHALQLPSRGGNTGFTDQHAAYNALSPAMKERVAGLRVHHVYNSPYAPRKMQTLSATETREAAPQALHPLVRPHPVDGRPALYLNPIRTASIEGMTDEEAQALLGELLEHSTQPQFRYFHEWQKDDVLIWDNPQALHMASHDYPEDELRLMHRTLVRM